MSKSYNGGSTIIKTRGKGWYISKQKLKKKNNEKENERLAKLENDKKIMIDFQPEFRIIRKNKDEV